jgi:hypothetical protein
MTADTAKRGGLDLDRDAVRQLEALGQRFFDERLERRYLD